MIPGMSQLASMASGSGGFSASSGATNGDSESGDNTINFGSYGTSANWSEWVWIALFLMVAIVVAVWLLKG